MNQGGSNGGDVRINGVFYYEKNRLFRWLVGCRKTRLVRFGVTLAFWYVAALIICAAEDQLLPEGEKNIGLLEDPITWSSFFMDLLMVSALFYAFRKLDSLFRRLPDMVEDPKVGQRDGGSHIDVAADCARIREFVSLRDRKSWPWYAACLGFMCVLVCILQVLLPLLRVAEDQYWVLSYDRSLLTYLFATAWSTFHFVIVIGNVLWYLLSTGLTVFPAIHRYAKAGRLIVIPIAPDAKGGMSPIGDFAFSLAMIASSGVVLVVTWIITFGLDPAIQIGLGFYLVLLVAVFFFPLLSVHKAMKIAKERELERWARRFQDEYSNLADYDEGVDGDATSQLRQPTREKMECLSRIDQLYRRVEAMPVWPFNVATLTKFISVIVAPLLVFIARLLTQGNSS